MKPLPWTAAACALALAAGACSDPAAARARRTTVPTYDTKTGRLTALTYDRNGNGVVDTWTDMDGKTPLRARIDTDEDGAIDRWEYYDGTGALLKVGFSRKKDGRVDAWAFSGADGAVARVEISSAGDERRIDRREFYEHGTLVRIEGDGNGDGIADRRLTYSGGALVRIESAPDASGRYTRILEVK